MFSEEELKDNSQENKEGCSDECDCENNKEDLLKTKILLLEAEIENLKKEQNDKMLEFVNKKSKEASEIIESKEKEISEKYKSEFELKSKYMYSKQLSEFTEVISQFEAVINSVKDPSVSNYLIGFKMFLSQFETLLDSFEISPIIPQIGEEFNSDIMQVSSTKDVDTEDLDNKITSVFKKGYKLHDRVIRLASVEVGKYVAS